MKPLTRREFVKYAAAGMAGAAMASKTGRLLAQAAAQAGGPKRPNILFVFADQMRFSAMGCMGNPCVRTPHLDRLAAGGMLMTNAFSSAPVCSPYRAQLLTGRYAHVNTITHNDLKLPESEVTLAETLKARGYATGYIGKWHLDGGRKASGGDPRRGGYVPVGAARQGFDYWAALECSHNYFKTRYYGDSETPVLVEGYEPDVQTDLAIEFMRQHKEGPFLLMMSWGPPHNPYKPPEKYDTYDPAKIPLRPNVPAEMQDNARKIIAQYYGLVTSLDANIGRLMQALDEQGLAEDTIFCFSSDHGDMLFSQGERLKQRPWEESAHIPFILRYPQKVRAGQKSDLLLNSVDVCPMLLGLCGVDVPKDVQGLGLSPVILGRDDKQPESLYLALDTGGTNAPAVGAWRAVRTKDWLYAVHSKGDWLLHDMASDPYQMQNLAGVPAAAARRAKLRALLAEWIRKTGDGFQLAE